MTDAQPHEREARLKNGLYNSADEKTIEKMFILELKPSDHIFMLLVIKT